MPVEICQNALPCWIDDEMPDVGVDHLLSLCVFPLRGTQRDDLLPTLRITHYRHTTFIAFMADPETETVSIVGLFYGGQNYAAVLRNEED